MSSEPTCEQLQQRVDDLGAALDSACVTLEMCQGMGTHPDITQAIDIEYRNCLEVLLRHGIRTPAKS